MKKRVLGLDIVRTTAILFVFCVHFFLYNNFYQTPLNSEKTFILLYFRWLFFTCVPLFLILTGYLKCKKKLEKNFYKDIIKILTSYFFIEIFIYLFKVYYLKENLSFLRHIINVFGFEVKDSSWYVEMYVGLFLLIPFLNLIYNGLKTKKQKQWLIISMLLLTGIPSIFSNMRLGINIFPDYWTAIYPITYYFIGAYIREQQIKYNKFVLIICLGLLLFSQTIFTFFNSFNHNLSWNFMGGYGSITVTVIAVLLFIILYDIDLNNKVLKSIITKISIYSFDMYLFGYIVDSFIYSKIKFINVWSSMKYFYLVLFSLLVTFIFAFIKDAIFKIIIKIYKCISR